MRMRPSVTVPPSAPRERHGRPVDRLAGCCDGGRQSQPVRHRWAGRNRCPDAGVEIQRARDEFGVSS